MDPWSDMFRSEVQRFELLEHIRHAHPNSVALAPQRRDFGRRCFAGAQARAHRFDFARQPLIFLRRSRLIGLHSIDHCDEELDLLPSRSIGSNSTLRVATFVAMSLSSNLMVG